MDIKLLNRAVNLFAKLAASPELFQLREPLGKKLHSGLWFGNRMAKINNDINNFAIFDNKIKNAIKNLEINYGIIGSSSDKDIKSFYLSHDKTKELIKFICDSYNQKFPKINAYDILNHLENQGVLDSKSENVESPIFILIHDLIHQVIEHDFVNQLTTQKDKDNKEVITLMDQLNEDLASSLSGFQPINETSQGLAGYIRFLFIKNFKGHSKREIIQTIEEIFHIAKAELRNKFDKIKPNLSESYISKSKEVPPKVKQLVDGILSKLKHQMLSNVDNFIAFALKPLEGFTSSNAWNAFKLQNIFDEYNKKITESSIIEQTDSSALRSWMIGCLSKMKELLNYFEHGWEEELVNNDLGKFLSYIKDEDEDEDED
jgi:hypothetical protein